MRNMLAVWREHGVDEAMRDAWEPGIVLAGLSAGAMCWFRGRRDDERRRARGRSPAWACSSGSLSVHLDGEPERLPAYRDGGRRRAARRRLRGRRLRGAGVRGATLQRVRGLADPAPGDPRSAPTARGGVTVEEMPVRGAASAAERSRGRTSRSPTGSPSCARCGPAATAGTDRPALRRRAPVRRRERVAVAPRRITSAAATSSAATASPIVTGAPLPERAPPALRGARQRRGADGRTRRPAAGRRPSPPGPGRCWSCRPAWAAPATAHLRRPGEALDPVAGRHHHQQRLAGPGS